MDNYSAKIINKMKKLYDNLSEKDKRHYAAVEAIKLEHGGINYISEILGCSRETIRAGINELEESLLQDRIRQPGGGSKKTIDKHPQLDEIFLKGN